MEDENQENGVDLAAAIAPATSPVVQHAIKDAVTIDDGHDMTTIGLHSCRSVPLQVTRGDDLIATSLANLTENDNTSDLQMNQLEYGYTQDDGIYGSCLQGAIDDGLNANVALQISKLDVFECYDRVPFCKYC
ncbi:hypothetical protein GOP47_0030915 [Adiantum capillus-veneris]|nr:hypothetical protein GOP47_0030915 [Adiantum capillus-veneris]